jgi:hypothetical protein
MCWTFQKQLLAGLHYPLPWVERRPKPAALQPWRVAAAAEEAEEGLGAAEVATTHAAAAASLAVREHSAAAAAASQAVRKQAAAAAAAVQAVRKQAAAAVAAVQTVRKQAAAAAAEAQAEGEVEAVAAAELPSQKKELLKRAGQVPTKRGCQAAPSSCLCGPCSLLLAYVAAQCINA